MKQLKRWVLTFLCVGVVMGVTACGSSNNADDNGAVQDDTIQNDDVNGTTNGTDDTDGASDGTGDVNGMTDGTNDTNGTDSGAINKSDLENKVGEDIKDDVDGQDKDTNQ